MLKKLFGSWISFVLFILVIGTYILFHQARRAVFHQGINPQTLQTWWLVMGVTYTLLFVLTSVFISLFFRILRRRVARFLQVACVANAFTTWLLFALSSTASDPITLAAISPLGLSWLPDALWLLGMLWWIPFLYILSRTIDVSPVASDERSSTN